MEIELLLTYYFPAAGYTNSQLKYSVIQGVFPAGCRLERPLCRHNLNGLTRQSTRARHWRLYPAMKIKKIDARNIEMLSSITH